MEQSKHLEPRFSRPLKTLVSHIKEHDQYSRFSHMGDTMNSLKSPQQSQHNQFDFDTSSTLTNFNQTFNNIFGQENAPANASPSKLQQPLIQIHDLGISPQVKSHE